MNVKLRNCFFVSTLLLILSSSTNQKILPSLISHFREVTPKQVGSHSVSFAHLSKNFNHQKDSPPEEHIKISPQLTHVGLESNDPTTERQLGAAENYAAFDVDFETTEIKDAVAFIEFKMKEITSLVEECIANEYANDATADVKKIKHECVGSTFQILFFNYNEGMKKIKDLLMEILKLKLQNLKEDYEDETNFFLDILESLVAKDYSIPKSLELAKKASKYYVSPRYFDRLVQITQPEINAFTELHERLKEQRNEIQTNLDEKEENEESYIHTIERKAKQLDKRSHHHRTTRKLQVDHKKKSLEYMKGLPRMNSSYSNFPPQSNGSSNNPNSSANKFYDKVENQLDGLSLFHNPAMPDESQNQFQSNDMMMPDSENNQSIRV